MSSVTVRNLEKHFGDTVALQGIDLDIAEGEFLCVLGPSGCGKTTLLRLLAGLEVADRGSVAFDGEIMSGAGRHVPPEDRRVGVVFQSYALWPHMTVAQNVGYPLRVARLSEMERRARIAAALEAVRLGDLGERMPHALSGGQQQRVALARCLVMRPRLVLMDEPLANLDMHLREGMRAEFERFHRETSATILYITHDQAEAMSIADRIAVMRDGRILQLASPELLYAEPASPEVAGFIGLSTLLKGVVEQPGPGPLSVRWNGSPLAARASTHLEPGDEVALCVRPEHVVLGEGEQGAQAVRAAYLGGRYLVELALADGSLLKAYSDVRPKPGDVVSFRIAETFAMRPSLSP
jgi:iron(III) transport system ATP-binding protein